MFQLNLLHVLVQLNCVLCFSFSDIFAKTCAHCRNGQGGIVFSSRREGGQLKIRRFYGEILNTSI